MTINEEGRPGTGGQWCGSAWGYTVYYSETRSINLTLYLSRLSGQVRTYTPSYYTFVYIYATHAATPLSPAATAARRRSYMCTRERERESAIWRCRARAPGAVASERMYIYTQDRGEKDSVSRTRSLSLCCFFARLMCGGREMYNSLSLLLYCFFVSPRGG